MDYSSQACGLHLLTDLQHPSPNLILFHADEQRAEIAVAEAVVAFTLDATSPRLQ